MKHTIGKGVLTWNRGERVSDRYGSVWLMKEGGDSFNEVGRARMVIPPELIGQTVTLKAHVTETRQSTHIGDVFRRISPKTPKVGTTFELGTGTLFVDDPGKEQSVGVRPSDGRNSDWLDPHILYQVHEQTVELYVEMEERDAQDG